ncbi:LCP family protein [Brevibacillus sp. H7]|uniref:LCP family protein n=1 Tax=Brevibacillus sp. H7 TaxID=3349138 RepID=UPI00380AD472
MQETFARSRASVHKQKKPVKRRKVRRLVVLFLFAMLILAGGVAGAIYWKINETLGIVSSNTRDGVNTLTEGVDSAYHSDKPISFVILGRDTRPETGSMNTDVMIVAVANPQSKKVTMVSLPRDTRIKIPGYSGYRKINEVYADGEAERRRAERNGQVPTENGVTLTKKTLKELLGIPIEHYVEVDFEGFKAVIDELGGVEVNVDRKLVYDDPTDDTHINLEPGLQLLNGEQALGYVRHRHDNRGYKYYSSDFDRSRRQQEVIKAIVDKTTSVEGVTKLFSIMDVAGEHIHTDMPEDKIKGLAIDFKGLSSASINSLDNGAYWKSPFTYLPKENLDAIRTTLQSEMGLSESVVAHLNDSPVSGSGGEETVTRTKPSTKKKPTESAAPAPAAKPKRESSSAKPGQIPAPQQTETPASTPETTQPPDIQPPAQPDGGTPPADIGSQTPPPDIVPPVTPEQNPGNQTQPDNGTTNS